MRAADWIVTGAASMALVGLLAAPALALDQEDLDTLSRHGESGAEAFAKFGNIGETLTHISSSKFGGTGSQRREMTRRVDAAMQPWRNASASAKGSLSYKVLPRAFTVSDEGAAMLASFAEGDYRGMAGTAVSVAVEPVAVGAFTAIGTGAGAVLGSFVPVVGNALGGVVGGAVGTLAGGYIGAYAHDKYVKELVVRAVEGGIAAVFDDTLQQAMRAKQYFLHQNASPEVKAEWDRMNAVSRSFGSGEGQVLDWERLPYIVETRPALPVTQQQAALPPAVIGSLLAGVKKIVLDGPTVCTIDSGQVNCTQPPANIGAAVRIVSRSLSGVAAGNTLELELHDVFEARDARCTVRTEYRGHSQVVLEDGGRANTKSSMVMTVTGCSKPMMTSSNHTLAGTWRVAE